MMPEKASNVYSPPVPQSSISRVVVDSFSHQGPFKGAIDFAVPIGTEVFAAANGIVTRIKDDVDEYGIEEKYGPLVNYVTIKHPNEELSEYLHLAKDSIEVSIGDKLVRGQLITKTGLSGRMTEPHLHFIVYKHTNDKHDFKGLEVKFDQRNNIQRKR